jgi:hypothetical protein
MFLISLDKGMIGSSRSNRDTYQGEGCEKV